MIEGNDLKQAKEVEIFGELAKNDHEQLIFCHDSHTGLKAIIGIHSTVLGPALGGTRMWNYTSDTQALHDVLRLARGMTYKAAISGLNLGGGKAVIIGDVQKIKNEALLRRFGKFVESLNGKYVTAEDMNMSPDDMEYIAMETRHVTGLSESIGGGGDPSPVTAYGVYMGMKAAAKKAYGNDSLEGRRIAVQGVGSVGMHLVAYLAKENAKLYVSDFNESRAEAASNKYNFRAVGLDEIYDLDVDIYSPCAMGATINDDTLGRLKCQIIAGAANNQLDDEPLHSKLLMEKGILYAPDFLINAGGLINVGIDYLGGWSKERVNRKTEKIYQTTLDIFDLAGREGISTQEAAMRLAEKRIADIAAIK
ncbi:MAG: Glu/Leu/Phe/Val dehydrogenase [Cyclobacteriaceae bacterium]|nr:Glu/Leu/Phe/Val dehydrogenase [Cyclobacteriaceae bacterium]